MVFRTAGAIAALLIGLGGGQALAQYYPAPPQAYPPQAYPPGYRPLPPLAEADDPLPLHDPSIVESRPLPPMPVGPQANDPPPPGYGRGAPGYPEEAALPPPSAPAPYAEPPPGVQGYEPASAATRPYTPGGLQPIQPGAPGPSEQDAARPPMPIGPGQFLGPAGPADAAATGSVRGDPRMAALPPDYRPETGPVKQLPPQFRRTLVEYHGKEPAGTIVIDTQNTYLYLVLGGGQALRYGVGVGREGFTWAGAERVTKMAEWPDWHPPEEMIERQPYLPRFMAGGPGNPLGARALYLGKTIYRIHGTNQPSTIGTFVSSGCIRLTNEDVMDLYSRVKVGSRVVVLPGRPPATASAVPMGAPTAALPGAPPVSTVPLGPPPSAMAR